jgi:hypothetical protein
VKGRTPEVAPPLQFQLAELATIHHWPSLRLACWAGDLSDLPLFRSSLVPPLLSSPCPCCVLSQHLDCEPSSRPLFHLVKGTCRLRAHLCLDPRLRLGQFVDNLCTRLVILSRCLARLCPLGSRCNLGSYTDLASSLNLDLTTPLLHLLRPFFLVSSTCHRDRLPQSSGHKAKLG